MISDREKMSLSPSSVLMISALLVACSASAVYVNAFSNSSDDSFEESEEPFADEHGTL